VEEPLRGLTVGSLAQVEEGDISLEAFSSTNGSKKEYGLRDKKVDTGGVKVRGRKWFRVDATQKAGGIMRLSS